jgi:phage protein D
MILMLILFCEIIIGPYKFNRHVHEVKVESSWQNLADTATIKLASLQGLTEKNVKPGMEVSIRMGYVGVSDTLEFEGFVKRVHPKVPVEIECEDSLYLLRKINLSKSFKDTTLKEVVNFIIKDTAISLHGQLPDVQLDKFRLPNINGAEALQKLKEEYGFVAYFRGKALYVGLAYTDKPGEVKYDTTRNVAEMKLERRYAEDTRIKVLVKSIQKDNSVIEVEEGDADGEQRTIMRYNIKDKATLKQIAKDELKLFKRDGYEGSFTGWLVPFAAHGMTAHLDDPDYPERGGSYLINKVTTTFGTSGGRRIIEPGIEV